MKKFYMVILAIAALAISSSCTTVVEVGDEQSSNNGAFTETEEEEKTDVEADEVEENIEETEEVDSKPVPAVEISIYWEKKESENDTDAETEKVTGEVDFDLSLVRERKNGTFAVPYPSALIREDDRVDCKADKDCYAGESCVFEYAPDEFDTNPDKICSSYSLEQIQDTCFDLNRTTSWGAHLNGDWDKGGFPETITVEDPEDGDLLRVVVLKYSENTIKDGKTKIEETPYEVTVTIMINGENCGQESYTLTNISELKKVADIEFIAFTCEDVEWLDIPSYEYNLVRNTKIHDPDDSENSRDIFCDREDGKDCTD